MLSDNDRRALAEIERHLEEDGVLCRSFACGARRRICWARGFWWAVLLLSLASMLLLAALGVGSATLESAVLVAVACAALRFNRPKPDDRVGRGRKPARRR